MAPPTDAWSPAARSITVVLVCGCFYVNKTISPITAVAETCLLGYSVVSSGYCIRLRLILELAAGGPERRQHCLLGPRIRDADVLWTNKDIW